MTINNTDLPPAISGIHGNGPIQVLVLHGWTMDSSVWCSIHSLIDETRFKFAFVDFPGYGVQLHKQPVHGMDGMANAALEAADALGWERFALLGHSMGGAAALRLATLAPERVTSVIAITPVSPSGMPLDEETYASFKTMWPDSEGALRNVAPHLSESQLQMMVAATNETMTRSAWEIYLHNWTTANFASSLGNYSGPVTLVVGESDPLITATYLAPVQLALTGAKLETLLGAGHYPMLEQSEQIVEIWERVLH